MSKGVMVGVGNKALALVARSGSYSLMSLIAAHTNSTPREPVDTRHPIYRLSSQAADMRVSKHRPLAAMVRNPIERFRSACARQNLSVDQGLKVMESDVHFWPLKDMGLIADDITYFRFPDQINDCAEWLGLRTPVPHENEEPEEKKPVLTLEQESAVRLAYADDIALWESLQ